MSATGRTTPRRRSAVESLLSIVLALEALLVFFITLVVFALGILPPAVAFTGGAALFALLLAVSRALRHDWGVWVGWILQAVLLATGFLVPLMFLIGTGFAAIWTYCLITGRRLDRHNAQRIQDPAPGETASAHTATPEPAPPEPATHDTEESP